MAQSWRWKLKVINMACQCYFILFCVITLALAFKLTLPEFCKVDSVLLNRLQILALYVFINVIVNYVCIKYKSGLSVVKDDKKNSSLSHPFETSLLLQENYAMQSFQKSQNVVLPVNDTADPDNIHLQNHSAVGPGCSTNCNNNKNSTSNEWRKESLGSDFHSPSFASNSAATVAGWSSCRDCEMLVPPRAKHCPLCEHCILKRDHHCFFAGCCIGFHNQRYFIMFCLYASLGAVYSSYVTSAYVYEHYAALQNWGIAAYFILFVLGSWVMGGVEGHVVGLLFYLYWCWVTAMVCGYYFIMQLFLIYRGQTKYECLKGIRTYTGTIWRNVRSVFGILWFVGVFVPGPFVGYYGDGKSWEDLLTKGD